MIKDSCVGQPEPAFQEQEEVGRVTERPGVIGICGLGVSIVPEINSGHLRWG